MNGFHGEFPHEIPDVQEALTISPHVPVIKCDARQRASTNRALTTLVEHALAMKLKRQVAS